jgi:hypothetical protein
MGITGCYACAGQPLLEAIRTNGASGNLCAYEGRDF